MEYENGLILLQEFIRKRPSLLVGSGLSVSMGIPGMDGLLKQLNDTFTNTLNTTELSEWKACYKYIQQLGFEAGLLKKKVSGSLLKHIINETAKFIDSYDEEFCEKVYKMKISDYPFAKLINHLILSLPPSKPVLDIVTTNYDHLVEYACDLIQVECCTGFKGSNIKYFKNEYLKDNFYRRALTTIKGKQNLEYRAIPKVRLLKPHGSLKWQKSGDVFFQSNKIHIESERVIITPGSTKFEASLTDFVMNTHRETANDAINRAESVIVLGYGFNDSHLQTVLAERLKDGLECLILTRSLTANAKSIIRSCNQVIALERESELNTRWYYNGQEGIWDEPIWDLNHFVNRII
ncbi:SIR2 family protein [Bacillus sp. 1P06AnD]|uniref:SIR2 family protein n=1 Tax=Bacillus sp. 1P06AnD TaxID=3132208 RepID=UPI0039A2AA00